MKPRLLFLCTGNSARSQMAEALAKSLVAPGVEVASAGTHPAGVNPLAVIALREVGLDITTYRSKRIDELRGEFDYVITLCDDAARECPAFPARRERLHWGMSDPAAAPGSEAARLDSFRKVRDDIERRLRAWLAKEKLLRK